ncbi:MAG: hypothetical protein PHN74_03550 [Candidatus Pacebacteria bacterium]|nr:hypothetical protein [Candidatus Paceibacterota bacterium]
MTRLLIAATIIGVGLAGAFFVVQQSSTAVSLIPEINDSTKNNPVENISLSDPLKAFAESQAKNIPNITQLIYQEIGGDIADSNPNGVEITDGKKQINIPDAEKLATELVEKSTKEFDPASLKLSIKDDFLKISADNSKKALTDYLVSFNKIIAESNSKMPTGANFEANFPNIVSQLIEMHQYAFNEIIKLSVPSLLQPMHKKELELLGTKINIFRMMADYQKDPVSSILASQQIGSVDGEFSTLNENLKKFIIENEL